MLRRAEAHEIEAYMETAYALALDPSRSGYPLFSDGILTKEQFVRWVWESHRQAGRELLLFCLPDGRAAGWIQFFWIEEDRYLQTDGFYMEHSVSRVLEEFIAYARGRFPGYALNLGFPEENEEAVRWLDAAGWTRAEQSCHDIFTLRDGLSPQSAAVEPVTEETFPLFRALHRVDADTYWNADRIARTRSAWLLYLYRENGAARGAICARDGEIYGIDYEGGRFDAGVYRALVTAVLHACKSEGRSHVVCFHSEREQAAALALGFRRAARYILFQTHL